MSPETKAVAGPGPDAPPQEALLARIAAREPDAVEACIGRYGGLVLSLARRFLSDESEIEEAVQDVFNEIWGSAGRYRPEVASEKTFVAMIARRRLIDRRRRQRARVALETLPEPASIAATAHEQDPVETTEELARVARALKELKPQQRTAIQLAILDGLSHSEVASTLDQPLGTIKSNIRRGLLRLRELLGVTAEGSFAR